MKPPSNHDPQDHGARDHAARAPDDSPVSNIPDAPPWLQRLHAGLQQQQDQLDLSTRMALARARQRALAQSQQVSRTRSGGRDWGIGAALASALLMLFVLVPRVSPPEATAPAAPLTPWSDLELLVQDEFPIFDASPLVNDHYDDDLEFYAWVENTLDLAG